MEISVAFTFQWQIIRKGAVVPWIHQTFFKTRTLTPGLKSLTFYVNSVMKKFLETHWKSGSEGIGACLTSL